MLGKPLNRFSPICTEYNLAAYFKTLGNKTIGFLTPNLANPCTLHRHTQIPFHKSAVTSEQSWIYFIEGGTEAGRTGSKEQFNFLTSQNKDTIFHFSILKVFISPQHSSLWLWLQLEVMSTSNLHKCYPISSHTNTHSSSSSLGHQGGK